MSTQFSPGIGHNSDGACQNIEHLSDPVDKFLACAGNLYRRAVYDESVHIAGPQSLYIDARDAITTLGTIHGQRAELTIYDSPAEHLVTTLGVKLTKAIDTVHDHFRFLLPSFPRDEADTFQHLAQEAYVHCSPATSTHSRGAYSSVINGTAAPSAHPLASGPG